MFQDIFLFIGLPATISAMNVLFNKNYWDIAGISWFIVGILKIYPINPLIGIVVIVSGICQYVYGYLKEKEKKKLLPIKVSIHAPAGGATANSSLEIVHQEKQL